MSGGPEFETVEAPLIRQLTRMGWSHTVGSLEHADRKALPPKAMQRVQPGEAGAHHDDIHRSRCFLGGTRRSCLRCHYRCLSLDVGPRHVTNDCVNRTARVSLTGTCPLGTSRSGGTVYSRWVRLAPQRLLPGLSWRSCSGRAAAASTLDRAQFHHERNLLGCKQIQTVCRMSSQS